MSKKVLVTLKLPQLQNLIKRDPRAYVEEFKQQQRHFLSELDILRLRPAAYSERFCELLSFLGHTASCYANDTADIPQQLIQLMETMGSTLNADVRAKLFQALVMMRNKGLLDPLVLLRLCFQLFTINDKPLRAALQQYIFTDIKNINTKKHDEKLNRSIQAVLFKVVAEDSGVTARRSVDILAELYRRRVWTDERTVNVIAAGLRSKSTKVLTSALNFFLGIEGQMAEDDDEEARSTQKLEVDRHEHR